MKYEQAGKQADYNTSLGLHDPIHFPIPKRRLLELGSWWDKHPFCIRHKATAL